MLKKILIPITGIVLVWAIALVITACKDPDTGGGDPITSKAALEMAIGNANTAKTGIVINTDAANVNKGTKWVTQEEMDALLDAIAAAETALANSTTQTQIDNAVNALNASIGVFNEAKKDGEKTVTIPCECCGDTCDCEDCDNGGCTECEGDPITSKAALETAIGNANTAKAGVVINTNPGNVNEGTQWVTEEEMDALDDAIAAAEAALANSTTQTQIGNAANALNAAIGVFNEAKKDGEKPVTTPCECNGNEDDCDCGEDCDCAECEPSDPCEGVHIWGAWSISGSNHTRSCTVCGEPQSHPAQWGSWTSKNATHHQRECQHADCNLTEEAAHTPGAAADCTTPQTCAVCGFVLAPALGHDFSVFVSTTPPTCTEQGYDTYKCSHCTETEQQNFAPALGHDWDWIETRDGVKTYTCNVCGETDEDEGVRLTLNLGDTGPGGGIIYFVADGQEDRPLGFTVEMVNTAENYTAYYLEAAPADMETRLAWTSLPGNHPTEGNWVGIMINGTLQTIGTGRKNTYLILSIDNDAPAAKACNNYNNNNKIDWFLPSYHELIKLYENRLYIVNMTNDRYWSSYDYSETGAYGYSFNTDNGFSAGKANIFYVRAIRAF